MNAGPLSNNLGNMNATPGALVSVSAAASSAARVDIQRVTPQAERGSAENARREVPTPAQIQARVQQLANVDREGGGRAQYDAPAPERRSAIAAYTGVAQAQQRDNIAAMFSVDLYA